MVPTLSGRWQTRILLYIFIGLPVTFLYALYLTNWRWPPAIELSAFTDPFVFLTAILILGLILDVVYIQAQRFRWEGDWPFAYWFFFSIVEFFAVYIGMEYLGILDYFLPDGRIPFNTAAWHFTFVFIPSFIAVLAAIQIFLVRWRYKGGELGRF